MLVLSAVVLLCGSRVPAQNLFSPQALRDAIGNQPVVAQAQSGSTGGSQAAVPATQTADAQVRRLTVEEAVRLALENNLGIRLARFAPQVEELTLVAAQTAWTPRLTNQLQGTGTDSPNNTFLSGNTGNKTTNRRFLNTFGLQKQLSHGGTYKVGWDGSRLTTNNSFTTFTPQLQSSLSLSFDQPLARGFSIDTVRQQVQASLKNREIADVQVRETVASTMRAVRNAYWNLAYAHASLGVQQQSLELAQESLRNTRARVNIGTTPPIDIVEAEAEVAQREEAVIVAEAQIETAEDQLRSLVFDPSAPDFWTMHIEAVDLPPFQPIAVDPDTAVRSALEKRTDLQQTAKSIEVNDINIRFFRNQSLPDVTASVNYGLSGLGGTQLVRGPGPFGPGTGVVIGETQRSFGNVLGDIFQNTFPAWTASLNVSYPLGRSEGEANLAKARLQNAQQQARLRNQQLQASTQVREAARQVVTNQKRVESTRASRALAERRLEAEQRKRAAGTSTNFVVFQTQRDLAVARNNELKAILDFNQSVVDLETVQEIPLTPTAGAGTAAATTAAGTTSAAAR
jgi:HAE1 family hydrophobic/amphiphilic exporter-1